MYVYVYICIWYVYEMYVYIYICEPVYTNICNVYMLGSATTYEFRLKMHKKCPFCRWRDQNPMKKLGFSGTELPIRSAKQKLCKENPWKSSCCTLWKTGVVYYLMFSETFASHVGRQVRVHFDLTMNGKNASISIWRHDRKFKIGLLWHIISYGVGGCYGDTTPLIKHDIVNIFV